MVLLLHEQSIRLKYLLSFITYFVDSSLRQTHGAKIVWEYMCRHLDLKRLIEWTNVQYPSVDNTDIPVSSTWPYSQPITSDMLQILKEKTTDYVKNEVLDTLAGCVFYFGVAWENTAIYTTNKM